MSLPFKLFRLQQIDKQLNQAKIRFQQIQSNIKNDAEIRRLRAEVSTDEQNYLRVQKQFEKIEQEVQTLKIKIEQTEASLYSGKIHNPKELQDLENENFSLKRYLSVLEDRLLETMIENEEFHNKFIKSNQELENIIFQFTQQVAKWQSELQQIQQEIDRIEKDHLFASSSIPDSDLVTYKKLLNSKKGIAVAQVIDKSCTACGSTLSASILQTATAMNVIAFCDSCGRILYGGK
jgi:predicted  nucleic acid-binding Zn-ribbon protein